MTDNVGTLKAMRESRRNMNKLQIIRVTDIFLSRSCEPVLHATFLEVRFYLFAVATNVQQ